MPYSLPSAGRPTHRRSFSSEQGPGAFASLGSLPRRTPATAKFHIEEQESESDEETLPPPLKLKIHRVPFPRSSPTLSPVAPPEKEKLAPQRPTPSRTSSSPILLSNGKPLKSSLKSSNSSPSIFSHLRARSEPATPNPELLSPTTPKNVHFPSQNLESVRVFNRSAKPASLLSASETETETEQESGWALGGFITGSLSRGFPFPRISSPPPPTETEYVLNLASNPVPAPHPDVYANVFLESLTLSPSSSSSSEATQRVASKDISGSLFLHGTLLLRNISYEKHASVRFTLDDWDTTSEVSARYIDSLSSPPTFLLPRTIGDLTATANASFDRFGFSIRLSDYLPQSHSTDIPLLKKRLFLAIKYSVPGKGEWWDNCSGANWMVAFRCEGPAPAAATAPAEDASSATRERSVSAPAVVVNAPNGFLDSNVTTPTVSVTPPPLHERGYSEGTAKAVHARLSNFRLMNYAAPKGRVSFPSPASSATSSVSTTPNVKERESYPFPSPPGGKTSPRFEGVLWPWGHQPSSPTKGSLAEPVLTPSKRGDESPLTPPPTPPVPQVSLPPVPPLERSRSNSTSSDDSFDGILGDLGVIEGAPPLPALPPSFPLKPTSGNPMESDMLYKAFVKEWCFGYSSPSTTNTHTNSAGGMMERGAEGSFMGVEV